MMVVIDVERRVISPYLVVYIECMPNIDGDSLEYDMQYHINMDKQEIKDFVNQVLVPFFNTFTCEGGLR